MRIQNIKILIILILVFMLPHPCFAQSLENETFANGNPKIVYESAADGTSIVRQEFYEDGQLKSVSQYVKGNINGTYKEFFPNGALHIEADYANGIQSGDLKEFYPNNQLKSYGKYTDGQLNGEQLIYLENGTLYQLANYYNSALHGEIKIFFPTGQIRQISNYQYGKLYGEFKIFGETGTLLSLQNYIDDRLDGPFFIYYDNGIIQESGVYKNDQVVLVQTYNEHGIRTGEVRFENELKDGNYFEYYDNGTIKRHSIYKGDVALVTQEYAIDGSRIPQDTTAPPPSDSVFASFTKQEVMLLLFTTILGILGTAFAVSGYYRTVSTRPLSPTIPRPNPQQQSEDQESDFRKIIDPTSDKMYRSLVETVRSGIYLADRKGILIYCNNTFAQLMGYKTKPEAVGLNLDNVFSHLGRQDKRFIKSLQASNSIYDYTFERTKFDGTQMILSTSANNVYNDRGKVIGVQGVVFDITEQSSLKDNLFTEKKKLELLMNFFETIDTIRDIEVLTKFIIDEISEILEANRCSLMVVDEETNGLKVCEAKGIDEYIKQNIQIDWGQPIAGQVAKEGKPLLIKNIEYDEKLKNYKKPQYKGRSLMAAPLIYEDRVMGVICVTDKKNEITYGEPFNAMDLRMLVAIASKVVIALDNVKIYNDLNLLSHTDPITQIYNYRLFNQSLDQEIARFNREKQDLAIFMMDLDSFKSYNDDFGHVEGDELLKNLGKILKTCLRETDIVCRYAGDEFCVVLPDTNVDGAQKAADKVLRGVREFQGFKRPVTISIGIAPYEKGLNKKDFIKHADAALYEAKNAGKNTVHVFSAAKKI